jgi:hypothetical protein
MADLKFKMNHYVWEIRSLLMNVHKTLSPQLVPYLMITLESFTTKVTPTDGVNLGSQANMRERPKSAATAAH